MTTLSIQPAATRHHDRRRPPELLTDDQYVATSLALVADLSRRVRCGQPTAMVDSRLVRKFCRTGFKGA